MTNGLNGQNGHKKKLETHLWNIADSLQGKMNADEFRDHCLELIFYKYLIALDRISLELVSSIAFETVAVESTTEATQGKVIN